MRVHMIFTHYTALYPYIFGITYLYEYLTIPSLYVACRNNEMQKNNI